jgi:hypothetical protein
MTERSPANLTVHDWIRLSPSHLRARGVDPDMRETFTGHRANLTDAWLLSIGNWGYFTLRAEVAEGEQPIFDFKEPHKALVRVYENPYRQFKYSYQLCTGPEFIARHGRNPWMHAELSWGAHRRMQELVIARNGTSYSIGKACRDACEVQRKNPDLELRYRTGLLPVEMVLYTRIFDQFLHQHGLSYDEWHEWKDEWKEELWLLGRTDGNPWTILYTIHEPAITRLAEYELAAAE